MVSSELLYLDQIIEIDGFNQYIPIYNMAGGEEIGYASNLDRLNQYGAIAIITGEQERGFTLKPIDFFNVPMFMIS